MNSTWNGPPGQMVKALGKCFHPLTKVTTKNGEKKCMKDIDLGEVLEDGSIVESVMKIFNEKNKIPFYEIAYKDKKYDSIFVTGSHLVFDDTTNMFIKVENYKRAKKTQETYNWFSCLITNTHKIPIGREVFWDWEDHFIKTIQLKV
jgi:hypothetical protein